MKPESDIARQTRITLASIQRKFEDLAIVDLWDVDKILETMVRNRNDVQNLKRRGAKGTTA